MDLKEKFIYTIENARKSGTFVLNCISIF